MSIQIEDTGNISDGYHTFNDLYEQRMILFATIVNLMPDISWKTKLHEDGKPCFEGEDYFLVTIETPSGNYGYHYDIKYWDMFKCKEIERAKHWDGYTDKDADRLLSLISNDKKCEYCSMDPPLYKGAYYVVDGVDLMYSDFTTIVIGKDGMGRVGIQVTGEGGTDPYYPKYCPECGRRLYENRMGSNS